MRMPHYIVLGYNDYNPQSHQWFITSDLEEARATVEKWERLHLICQIRWVGDVIDNPLSGTTGKQVTEDVLKNWAGIGE